MAKGLENAPFVGDTNARFGALAAVTRVIPDRIREQPLPWFVAALTALTGLAASGWWALTSGTEQEAITISEPQLADALEALDSGNREAARNIAADLRLRDDLPIEELGGPPFVLGLVLAQDAAEKEAPAERRALNLLVSRYLEEALQAGLPPERKGHAEFTLGKALYDCGRYAESLPVLRATLESYPERATEIHRLLAGAYLKDARPQLDQSLRFNRLYLTSENLTNQERDGALLTQSQILLKMNDLAGCRQAIEQMSEDSAAALLIEGQIELQEGNRLGAAEPRQSAAAMKKYQSAGQLFTTAAELDPGNREIVRMSRYLQGVAHSKLSNYSDAESVFSRTQHSHFNTPEGLAAGFQEAEMQRELGRHSEAIESYRSVLRQAAEMSVYSNPWIPLEELRERTEQAYQAYLRDKDFDRAIALTNVLSPMFPIDHATQLQAAAQQAKAEHLMKRAESASPNEVESVLAEAQAAWRKAGSYFTRLAQQRFATRKYPESLWKSATAYLRGHDYRRSKSLLKEYLEHERELNHPPALTALGSCLLALGEPAEAIEFLEECIESFPKDPHSYRARLVAAQAYTELGQLPRSRALLIGNLEHEGLEPSSIDWRESLFALGKTHFREGLLYETQSRLDGVSGDNPERRKNALKPLEQAHDAFQQAILRLSEAVDRDALNQLDPFRPETIEARYLVAEAQRQSAKLPLKRLSIVSIETTQNKLNDEIKTKLGAAASCYLALQQLLNQKQDQSSLTDSEQRILRNCYFARADVLYDLKLYEEAIKAYSTATSRYQHEPESLEAYLQIANCHRILNRPVDARGTLKQARIVLERLPADAVFTDTTRYGRAQWTRLLDWLTSF